MPENDKAAGSTDQKVATTFTQEQLNEAVVAARKDGEVKSYRHFQSVTDKSFAELKRQHQGELGTRDARISELRKAQLAAMSPSDRSAAMIEEMHSRSFGQSSQQTEPEDNRGTQQDIDREVQTGNKDVNDALVELGYDLAKVNWNGGTGVAGVKAFLESIRAQTPNTEASRAAAAAELKKTQDAQRIDAGKSTGGGSLLAGKSIDDLFKAGHGQRVRGGRSVS